jgi:hypothetical protein
MEDMEMDGAFEPVAVELVAQGVIGKRVDEMESGFLMALDYMIQLAQKDTDDEVLGSHCLTPPSTCLHNSLFILH